MGDLQKELAQKFEETHGKILSEKANPNGSMTQIVYSDRTVIIIKNTGACQSRLATGVTICQLPNGKKFHKQADGKMLELTDAQHQDLLSEAKKASAAKPALSPKKGSPVKKASPKKEEKAAPKVIKRKIIKAADSSSDSSSSGSSDSSDSDDSSDSEKPVKTKKAPAKRAKATRKPPTKKASSPRTKRKRSPSSDSSSSSEQEKEPEAPYESDQVTLARIAIKLGEELDLSDAAEAEKQRLLEEEKKNKKPPRKPVKNRFPASWDALEKKLELLSNRISTQEANMSIKDGTKEVSLGTSKTNYIDPRVIYSWAKRENVRLSQIYNTSLLKKFVWAKGADVDWRFAPKK